MCLCVPGKYCEPCRARHRIKSARYKKTLKGRETRDRYNHSAGGKELHRYWQRSKRSALRIMENKP